MIITDKTAGEFWCPFSRGSFVDSFRGDGGTACLGTRCAAFRQLDLGRGGYCGNAGRLPPAVAPVAAVQPREPQPMVEATRPVHVDPDPGKFTKKFTAGVSPYDAKTGGYSPPRPGPSVPFRKG